MALNTIYMQKASNETKEAKAAAPAPEKKEPVKTEANEASHQTDDLISKVTQFETEKSLTGKSEDEIDSVLFSDKELRAKLDSITDPALKEQFINMRKSMMRGVNDKFQEMATLRKELEALKANASRPKFSANSVEELLQNQEFIAEAQRISGKAQTLAEDDTLSDAAKAEISRVNSELEKIKRATEQQETERAQRDWQSQHDALSQRYKNYDKLAVDKLASELVKGEVKATPEHLYKVLYHDENVRRAYELGRRESAEKMDEKKSLSSINGVNAVKSSEFKQEEKEDNRSFLERIIANRLASGSKQ